MGKERRTGREGVAMVVILLIALLAGLTLDAIVVGEGACRCDLLSSCPPHCLSRAWWWHFPG